jgi:cell wall-active antibiotic response 4TMS protein YvqF
MRSRWNSGGCVGGGIVSGLVILSIGVLFLLSNFGILGVQPLHTWWPVLLIVIGAARLFGYGRWHDRRWQGPSRPYNNFN